MSAKHIGACCCGEAACYQPVLVLGCGGLPAPGVPVIIEGGGTATTGGDGIAVVPFPGPGTYTLSVRIALGVWQYSTITITTCTPGTITVEFGEAEGFRCAPGGCCAPHKMPDVFTFTDPQGPVQMIWRPAENTWRSDMETRTPCDGRIWRYEGAVNNCQVVGPTRSIPGGYTTVTRPGSFRCYFIGSPCGIQMVWRGLCGTNAGYNWPLWCDHPDFTNPSTASTRQFMNLLGSTTYGWSRSTWECSPLLKVNTYGIGLNWAACHEWDRAITPTGDRADYRLNWLYGPGPHSFSVAA